MAVSMLYFYSIFSVYYQTYHTKSCLKRRWMVESIFPSQGNDNSIEVDNQSIGLLCWECNPSCIQKDILRDSFFWDKTKHIRGF